MKSLCLSLTAASVASLSMSAVAGPYSDAVLADNPIAYYQFEGNYDDSSGIAGNNNGTASNGGIPFGAAGTTFFDQTGQFADADGSGFVTLGASSAADSLTNDLQGTSGATVEFLIDLSSVVGPSNPTDAVFFLPSGTSAGLTVGVQNFQNRLFFGGRSQASDSFVSRGQATELEGVHHVAFTVDYATTTITLYVDGVELASSTGSDTGNFDFGNANAFGSSTYAVAGSSTEETIGTAAQTDSEVTGDFDELAIYNRVLTAAEVQAHYNAYVPEPGSMALLALGGTCLLARRK